MTTITATATAVTIDIENNTQLNINQSIQPCAYVSYILASFIIIFPFIICDFYYAFTYGSCMNESNIIHYYLLIDGLILSASFITLVIYVMCLYNKSKITAMYTRNKQFIDRLMYVLESTFRCEKWLISSCFIAWIILGSVICWKFNYDTLCSDNMSSYIVMMLIIRIATCVHIGFGYCLYNSAPPNYNYN